MRRNAIFAFTFLLVFSVFFIQLSEQKIEGEADFDPIKDQSNPALYDNRTAWFDNVETATDASSVIEQGFGWGVLAINTHKSIYLPGEKAFVGIAVLDDKGKMVCDADVTLVVTDPTGEEARLTTKNGKILVSDQCSYYGVTDHPDYYTHYKVNGPGTYRMELTAVTKNGINSITDEFEVQENVSFDVIRDGPTRINPSELYTMRLTIIADEDYSGLIREYVPTGFEITPQDGLSTMTIGDTKVLTWNKELTKGNKHQLVYEFDAPDISPYFYTLGALEVGAWSEVRQWQIANDVVGQWDDIIGSSAGIPCNTPGVETSCTPTTNATEGEEFDYNVSWYQDISDDYESTVFLSHAISTINGTEQSSDGAYDILGGAASCGVNQYIYHSRDPTYNCPSDAICAWTSATGKLLILYDTDPDPAPPEVNISFHLTLCPAAGGNYFDISNECSAPGGVAKCGIGSQLFDWVEHWPFSIPLTTSAPADQTIELGDETTIVWNLQGIGGFYYVERNGTLFEGPTAWSGNTTVIIRPNVYFLGDWNYTMFFNDTVGKDGTQSETTLTVVDNVNPSCSDVTGGGAAGTDVPTLVSITVDGDMGDWDAVLTNPKNLMTDQTLIEGDPDTDYTSDRDMTAFAYTYDSQYIYFYFSRKIASNRQISLPVYIDYDRDGYMNSTDKVVKFVWSGSNRNYDADLYNYNPDGGTPDPMLGDGEAMNGTITINKSLEQDVLGGSEQGIEVETRVLWTDLGLSGPSEASLNLQAASALGSGTNLPSQLQDNYNTMDTENSFIIFRPDRAKTTKNGTFVYYDHDIMNCGNNPQLIEFSNTTSQGWDVTLYYPYSNETTIADSNSNGQPDITLNGEEFNIIIVRVYAPTSATLGTVDIANITADTTNQSITVRDNTTIADIAISPLNYTSYGTQDLLVSINYTVYNYQPFNDVIGISATSSNGWTVSFYYANGTMLSDTDSDGTLDVGNFLPSQSTDIIVQVQVPPSAVSGTTDTTTIKINSSVDPINTITSTAKISVRDRLTMVPDGYNRTVTPLTRQYYNFTITNNWNQSDTIELTYTSTENWNTSFVDENRLPLIDTDGDSIVDTGPITAYGGTKIIYAKILVLSNVSVGVSEITTMYANSSLNTSLYMTGIINSTPMGVAFYNNTARTIRKDTFEAKETVYSRAFYLQGFSEVFMVWYDGLDPVRTSPNITVTGQGYADDMVVTNTSLGLGTWTVIVHDSSDNSTITSNTFEIIDPIIPNATVLKPLENSTFNTLDIIEIAANATDNYAIDSVFANISFPNGTSYMLNLTNKTGNRYNNTFTIPNLPGVYNVTILANDSVDNINNTEKTNFTVIDTIPPTIILDYPVNNTYYNPSNWTWINGTAIDPTLDVIYTNDSTWSGIDTSSPFNFSNSSEITDDWHYVRILANDSRNNTAIVDVNFYFNNTIPPPNIPPTTPTNIICKGLDNCNITVDASVVITASGSTDPEGEDITYFIEAFFKNTTDTSDLGTGSVSMRLSGGTTTTNMGNLMFEDFEGSGWNTIGGEDPEFGCSEGFGTNFNNCQDNGDYEFARSFGGSAVSGTYMWVADDWTTWVADAGIWYNFNPQTACNGNPCEEVNITGYGAGGSLDTGDYCRAWGRNDTTTNSADIWYCTNGDACEFGGGASDMPSALADWTYFSTNFTSILGLSSSTNASIHIGGQVPDANDQCFFDDINITGFYLTSNDANTSYTTYNDIGFDYGLLTNITVEIEVDSFNPEASVTQSTSDPDLELEIYNSTDWVTIGTFNLPNTYTGDSLDTTNYNFSLSTADSTILTAWQTSSNQDIRIRATYMDYYNPTVVDEINYTNIWITIDGKRWMEIGNHTETTNLTWDTSSLPEQTGIDLRARAIDLDGSNTYSSYFTKGSFLNISHPVKWFYQTQSPSDEVGQNSSISLWANWTGIELAWAWLETNETGTWENKTGVYGSPMDINNTAGQNRAIFIWQNSSVPVGTHVSWRIWANDSSGRFNVTNIMTFTVASWDSYSTGPCSGQSDSFSTGNTVYVCGAGYSSGEYYNISIYDGDDDRVLFVQGQSSTGGQLDTSYVIGGGDAIGQWHSQVFKGNASSTYNGVDPNEVSEDLSAGTYAFEVSGIPEFEYIIIPLIISGFFYLWMKKRFQIKPNRGLI